MLLKVTVLRVFYGKVEAVRGVNLQANEGDFVTIIGSNGAGKTSILNAISGVVADKQGEIWFEGDRIDRLSAPDIAKRGVVQVPEGRRVFPLLTVMENLKMGSYMYRDRKKEQKQFEVVFDLFPKLKERSGQKGQTLSGGEQQMLAIGRALMACPKLLLLDEPSLGLSPLLTRTVADQMTRINQAGTSIILVEQNAGLALQLAERAYVMETGDIALEGTTQQLEKNEGVRKAYLALWAMLVMATCLGSGGLRLSNVGPIQVARNWAEWWGLKIIRLNYRNPILNDPRAERGRNRRKKIEMIRKECRWKRI